ncbi:prenyltransferase [Nocardioides ferulae]|uniref:prenyltransferase n=1 Tax=Nocardioides ferulae TaxID=2340821 RepID=UPI000EAB9F3A|nr:prenyltransferase [Nocardioides ferulae]
MTASTQTGSVRGSVAGQVLASSRPLSWVNTAYPFGAAYLLAGGGLDLVLVLGCFYFLVPYNLLMYGVNDVFDYESDLRNPRKGGVEGVVLDRRVHRTTIVAAAVSILPFLVALALLGDAVSNAVLAVSVFAVIAYSAPRLRFKERPFLDSLTSSTHFVSPAVFGLALAEGAFDATALAALGGFFAWGVASHAFGAVQDIEADRAADIGSVATVLGARATTWFALVSYLAAGGLLATLGWPAALAALLTLPYAANVARFLHLTDAECEQANAGWRRFLWLNYLTGFLVTQLFLWMAL